MQKDIARRVILAKYILERAERVLQVGDEMGASISLLLMHDAIELLMLAVLDHLKIHVKPKREFMDFWSEVKQAGLAQPPDSIPMQSLNKLRVGLKHNGNTPNPKQVLELFTRTKGFFENVLTVYCNISYEDASLVDLIEDQNVRETIRNSRATFIGGQATEALIELKVALHSIENPTGKVLPLLQAPIAPSVPPELQRSIGRYVEQLHSFLALSASRINAIVLGIDPIRHSQFMRSTPSLVWSPSGTYQAQLWGNYEAMTVEDYDELASFLIDYAIRAQGAYVHALRGGKLRSGAQESGQTGKRP